MTLEQALENLRNALSYAISAARDEYNFKVEEQLDDISLDLDCVEVES